MNKLLQKLGLAVFVALLCGIFANAQAGSTPETTIKNFYKWYVSAIAKNKFPLAEQPTKMKSFITVRCYNENKRAYDKNEFDADYFIAAQDFDDQWATNLKVSNVKISGFKATANVALFGKNNFNHKLKLKLLKQNGVWKIDVIDPIFD